MFHTNVFQFKVFLVDWLPLVTTQVRPSWIPTKWFCITVSYLWDINFAHSLPQNRLEIFYIEWWFSKCVWGWVWHFNKGGASWYVCLSLCTRYILFQLSKGGSHEKFGNHCKNILLLNSKKIFELTTHLVSNFKIHWFSHTYNIWNGGPCKNQADVL